MAVSRGFWIGALTLLAALGLALGIVLFSSPSDEADAAGDYRPPGIDQSRMILRLPDLPAGYVSGEGAYGDGIFCAPFTRSQDALPPLGMLVRAYRLEGCIAFYERLFTPPGAEARAPIVFSGVLALGSGAATDAVWALLPRVLRLTTRGKQMPVSRPAPLKVGAATRLFRTDAVPASFSRGGSKATFLAWRSGTVVAVVLAIGRSFAETDATVAELAPRQQDHIRKPTPYTGAERYDGEVALEDPALTLPVYWLGRSFRPGGGLPKTTLRDSSFPGKALPEREGHDYRATYTLEPQAPLRISYAGFSLDTWTDSTWHLFTDSADGRSITSWNCTKTRTVTLPEGTATIFGGYRRDLAKCPAGPPHAFTAWVEIGGVKVVVNPPLLADYSSFEGMEAIVRALKLRPKPLS